MTVATAVGYVVAFIAISGAVGAAVAVIRSASITEMRSRIDVLQGQVEFEQRQRELDSARHSRELEAVRLVQLDQERKCERDLADLRGEVRALTSGLAERIVAAVVEATKDR